MANSPVTRCTRMTAYSPFSTSIRAAPDIHLLPEYVVSATSAKGFRTHLHNLVKYLAVTGYEEWKSCLNRRTLTRSVLPRISRAILEVTGATDFNVLQNNGEAAFQSVFHVHFHIIPKHEDGSGLAWPFITTQLDTEEGKILAESIRKLLG